MYYGESLLFCLYMALSGCVLTWCNGQEASVGSSFIRSQISALAGVTKWVGHHPTNRKVTGLIPNWDTLLGHRPGPQLGVCKRQPIDVSVAHQCFSSSLSPSFSPSLKITKNNFFKRLNISFYFIFITI